MCDCRFFFSITGFCCVFVSFICLCAHPNPLCRSPESFASSWRAFPSVSSCPFCRLVLYLRCFSPSLHIYLLPLLRGFPGLHFPSLLYPQPSCVCLPRHFSHTHGLQPPTCSITICQLFAPCGSASPPPPHLLVPSLIYYPIVLLKPSSVPGPDFGCSTWYGGTRQQGWGKGILSSSPPSLCPIPRLPPPSEHSMSIPSNAALPPSLPGQTFFPPSTLLPSCFFFSCQVPPPASYRMLALGNPAQYWWGVPRPESSASDFAAGEPDTENAASLLLGHLQALWTRHPHHTVLDALIPGERYKAGSTLLF